MNIDLTELKKYFKSKALHVEDAVMDDWLRSSAEIINLDLEKTEQVLSTEQKYSKIDRNLRYAIDQLAVFSPRDMGVLYVSHNGGYISYGDDRVISTSTVIQEKLGMTNVTPISDGALRSMYLKDFAVRGFASKMKSYGLTPLDHLMNKVRQKEVWDAHPWMACNPGGLYKDEQGKVWMVDFRIPKNGEKAEDAFKDIGDSSRAAMAQNKAYIEGMYGIKVDHCSVSILNVEDFSTLISTEYVDDTLCLEVTDIGDYYYNEYLMKGIVPVVSFTGDIETVSQLTPAMKKCMIEVIASSSLCSLADKRKSAARSRLEELCAIEGVILKQDGKKTKLAAINFGYKENGEKLDPALLKKKFIELGGNPNDPELMVQTKPTLRMDIARGKNHPDHDFILEVKDTAETIIKDTMSESLSIHDVHVEVNRNFDPSEPAMVDEFKSKAEEKSNDFDDELALF
ncbi:hypothetical protein LMH73_012300 [Vibrio splendidus]|nr:hypothetical protein [Vibrio splendidus]MCC4880409.1 hypothetical protein [Vibrio splendidus]